MYILRDHKWTPMDLPPRLKKWILPATAEPLRIPLRSYILAHYPPEIITILNFMIIIPLLFILVLQSSYISLNDVYLFKTYVNSLTHTACVLLWLLFNITFETHPHWCTQWGLFLLTALQYGSVWVHHSLPFTWWIAIGLFLQLLCCYYFLLWTILLKTFRYIIPELHMQDHLRL